MRRCPLLLGLLIACGLMNAPQARAQDDYPDVVLADEPVAYYRFEEGAGDDFIEDSGGEGRDSLSFVNASLGAEGVVGQAVEFFGDGSIELDLQINPADSEDDGIGNGLDDFSIEIFLKPSDINPANVFLAQKDGFGTGRSVLLITSGTAELGSFLGGGSSRSTVVAQSDTWYHFVMTYDGGALGGETLRFYVDGEFAGSGTRLPESADGNWVIGSHKGQAIQFYAGLIDELSFYDYRLDDPDGDDDTVDSRVLAHFEASSRETATPRFVRGDADADGGVNVTDGIAILNFLFSGGTTPPCADAADTDDSGSIAITDGIAILNFLFSGGDDPRPPSPECGVDPTEDELDCGSFAPCAG